MRLILFIILIFGCGIRPVTVPVVDPIPNLPKTPIREMGLLQKGTMEYTVAFVKVDEDNDVVPYCSGVWVSMDEILLAAHCLKEKPDKEKPDKEKLIVHQSPIGKVVSYTIYGQVQEVLEKPTEVYEGQVTAYDEAHDLALVVVVNIPVHRFVLLALEMPAIGETVYMVGHPSLLYWSFIEGIVSSYRYHSSSGRVIQVNASIWYGNSGGGLFDGEGNLLGICSRIIEGPNMSYFIHLDHIKKFLELNP